MPTVGVRAMFCSRFAFVHHLLLVVHVGLPSQTYPSTLLIGSESWKFHSLLGYKCVSQLCSFFWFAALALTLIDDYQWIPWSCKLKVATVQRTNAQEYPHTRPHSLYLTDLPPLSMSLVPLPPFRPVKVWKRRPCRPHPFLAGPV